MVVCAARHCDCDRAVHLSHLFQRCVQLYHQKPHQAYKFIGFKNYAEVLKDSGFWLSFFHSLKWTVLSLIGQIVVGFTAALALKRIKVCKGIYKTLLIIPWAFPSIVIAFSWKWILNGVYGFLPNVLVKLGLCETAPQFLTSGTMAFLTLVMINIWFGAPMIMVNVLSALETVPRDHGGRTFGGS